MQFETVQAELLLPCCSVFLDFSTGCVMDTVICAELKACADI